MKRVLLTIAICMVGTLVQLATAPLFGIDILSWRECFSLAMTLIVGCIGSVPLMRKRTPPEPDFTDVFPLKSNVITRTPPSWQSGTIPEHSAPPQGGSASIPYGYTTQEVADALATMGQALRRANSNSYVEPYTPPASYLASVEDVDIDSEWNCSDGDKVQPFDLDDIIPLDSQLSMKMERT